MSAMLDEIANRYNTRIVEHAKKQQRSQRVLGFEDQKVEGTQDLAFGGTINQILDPSIIVNDSKDTSAPFPQDLPLIIAAFLFPWKSSYSFAGKDFLIGDRPEVQVPGQVYDLVGFTSLSRSRSAYVAAERQGGNYRVSGTKAWQVTSVFMPWRSLDFFADDRKRPSAQVALVISPDETPPNN